MLAILLTAALSSPNSTPSEEPLRLVDVRHRNAPALARRLHGEGFDVLHEIPRPTGFRIFATTDELDELEARGIHYVELQRGRPFRDIQRERNERIRKTTGVDMVPPGYRDLATLITAMQAASAAHPSICEFVDLTATYGVPPTHNGHHIYAIKISDNVGTVEDEPTALLVNNHHSREIVTPELGMKAIEELTTQYGSDPAITQVVDEWEIWISPVFNPDGYEHVFNVDNFWRKNRRNNLNGTWGVDLNRNYPFGWTASCSGSTSTSSQTYKGPAAASEQETVTMIAWSDDRHWAKVQDNHSFGNHIRYGYGCGSHPWLSFMQSECTDLSVASGYGGFIQGSCCLGGQFSYQIATHGAYAFLWETEGEFQPSYADALAEADRVFQGSLAFLQRPIPITGHVVDACTGQPIDATITFQGVGFSMGEQHSTGGAFGRYHAFPPPGNYNLQFDAPGYITQVHNVDVASITSSTLLDVALVSASGGAVAYCTPKVNSQGCTPVIAATGHASASSATSFDVDASQVVSHRNGLLFYGFAAASIPFQGGFLCVQPPTRRTVVQDSAGNPPPTDCSGTFSFEFNGWIQSGSDPNLIPGTEVHAQYWYRDPQSPSNTGLTDATRFGICP